jgi:hypothetical protein
MRTVSYGGESFITSDDGADALLGFAAAAALSDFADVIHMPAIGEDGEPIIADLVVGPSSELLVVPCNSPFDEPDTTEIAATLRRMTAKLGSPRVSFGGAIAPSLLDDGADLTDIA